MSAEAARAPDAAPDARAARRRDLGILLAIALVAFGLRLVSAVQYEAHHPNAAHLVIDERSYDRWARAIAAGDWMGEEVFFQEPLYPYALGALYALAGPSPFAARVAQAGLWALATFLAGLLARRVFGRAPGFAAAVLLCAYWPGLLFPNLLLKENLLLPILFALALVLVRTRAVAGRAALGAWALLGVLAGLGAVLRGNVLVLLPLLVLWPLGRRLLQRERLVPGLAHAACVALGVACVLLPVAWRNWHVGGVFALTTSGAGTNLYGGNNLENPTGRATEFPFIRGIPEHEAGDWRREAERRTGRSLDPQEVSAFWRDEVLRSVREHPWEHARILWNKLRLTLGAYEVPDNHMLEWDEQYVAIARLPWPGFAPLCGLGLGGMLTWALARCLRRTPRIPCPGGADELALVFLLYLGTVVLTVTSDRARLPLVVMLVPFAGWIVAGALGRWSEEGRPTGWRVVVPGFLALGIVMLGIRFDRSDEDWDERQFNLAVQWLSEPAHEPDGRRIAEELLARHGGSARVGLLVANYDLVRALRNLAEPSETAREAGRVQLEDVLQRAEAVADDARVFPRERFRANALAAWAALDLAELDPARFETAAARFGAARAFDSDAADLKDGEARALVGLARGEFQGARAVLDARPVDEARRPEAQAAVERALDRLQRVAQDDALARAPRAEARALAGWIQLWLGRLPNAERHFRAALALEAAPNARLGLAQVLVARAEADVASRAALLAEAEAELERLPADEAVAALRARIAALRE